MSTQQEDKLKDIISHCKEYGFVFPSSEIYDGLSATYDYGQLGSELKNNIRQYWWKSMVQMHENIVGIDAAIFMHPTTWKASGHVDAFNDPLIDNKDSKKRYRADVLLEEHIEKIRQKNVKEVEKAAKKFGGSFEEALFISTNPNILRNNEKIKSIENRMRDSLERSDLKALHQLIIDLEIVCPVSGTRNWTEVRQFNLMFATKFGAVESNDEVLPPKNRNELILFEHFKRKGINLIEPKELESLGFDKALIPDSGVKKIGEYLLYRINDQLLSYSEIDINTIYLRPETAQGIFVNFLNVQKTGRMKIPFGIAQTGKAFRNEIVARQFIFRMREFEQMEMQFFVRPGTEMEWYNFWKEARIKWHKALGIADENYRFHDHIKLAHYANAACDIEFNFPMGFKELEGIHSRTDFDLTSHEKFSGKNIKYFDHELNQSYVPYVIETSIGLDRMFLAILSNSYVNEKLDDGTDRVVLRIPPALAPVKAAVLPLVKKDGLPEIGRKIFDTLKMDFNCQYDEGDSIGKRYRRQDAIGTPYCITIDHQTAEDNTVTIRERDSMAQERVSIDKLPGIIDGKVNLKKLLSV